MYWVTSSFSKACEFVDKLSKLPVRNLQENSALSDNALRISFVK
jgi:hypothetical protein